jgi:hypothetical protein
VFSLTTAGFFGLFFLYLWLRIEPSVEYHHAAPPFFLSQDFLRPFLGQPGGLVAYGAAFLAQLNRHDWLGALVYTGLGLLLFLATGAVLRRMGGGTPRLALFVPPFLLLLLRDRYASASLEISMGLLLALGPALGFMSLRTLASGLRLAVCWILMAVLFHTAGLWPCAVFGGLVGLWELAQRRAPWASLGCLLAVVTALLATVWGGDMLRARLWNPWDKGLPLLLAMTLHLFVPVTAWVLVLQAGALRRLFQEATGDGGHAGGGVNQKSALRSPAARREAKPVRTPGWKSACAAGFLAVGWVCVWLGLDGVWKATARMDYWAGRKEFDRVVALAAGLPRLTPASEIRLHRALHHTGRLGQDLFAFTNQTMWSLLPALSHGVGTCRAQAETLLDLGQVNMAEHYAHEALEWEGERPDLLRLLALVNVLEGRPRAARVFLNRLAQAPFHRQWAAACLRALDTDPRLSDDKELGAIRSRMVMTDLPHNEVATDAPLRQLLHSNSRNRMAFDYLMAHYLLTLRVDKLVERLGQLEALGYTELPRHYEEAVLLHQQLNPGVTVDLCGRQMRPETLQRFQRFTEALGRRVHESPDGLEALARDFGDTFWYYWLTRRTASPPTGGSS